MKKKIFKKSPYLGVRLGPADPAVGVAGDVCHGADPADQGGGAAGHAHTPPQRLETQVTRQQPPVLIILVWFPSLGHKIGHYILSSTVVKVTHDTCYDIVTMLDEKFT